MQGSCKAITELTLCTQKDINTLYTILKCLQMLLCLELF